MHLSFFTDEVEHWNENDAELDIDFPPDTQVGHDTSESQLDTDQKAIVWWMLLFTFVFQTLHSLPSRAIVWLLKFISCVLTVLGMYSVKVAQIAQAFPSTLHRRTQYLKRLVSKPTVSNMVVCPSCHALYLYKDCTEKRRDAVLSQSCSACLQSGNSVALLKQVITSQGNKKLYPKRVYPVSSLISSLQAILIRPGLLEVCEQWRQSAREDLGILRDVYDGNMWKDFLYFKTSLSWLRRTT